MCSKRKSKLEVELQFGYYSTKETIFNKGGDFTTSPEISQMFGEMVGVWLMMALKNYEDAPTEAGAAADAKAEAEMDKDSKPEKPKADEIIPKSLKTINLVEIGPGTGIMMVDILRTLHQFTGNLRNVQINLIEASPNLRKVQQEKLLKYIQEDLQIFLQFEVPKPKDEKSTSAGGMDGLPGAPEIDRFHNKGQNFSISWYPSFSEYYNGYLSKRLELMNTLTDKGKKKKIDADLKKQAANDMADPCFVIAHELFDALPVHQFHYSENREWCEKVLALNKNEELQFEISNGPTKNTKSVLQPEKFFTKEAKEDLKPGDSIEICPSATQMTKEICNLLELSRGMGLVIDYGESHSFSNSFRGLKNHKLVKDEQEILDNMGNIDLTTYVNFNQIR